MVWSISAGSKGFELVIEGPALRGLDGRVGRALAGHDDDGQRRLNLPDLGQGVQAVHAGQADVQNDQVNVGIFQAPHGLFGAAHADDLVPPGRKNVFECPQDVPLVVNYENLGHGYVPIGSGATGIQTAKVVPFSVEDSRTSPPPWRAMTCAAMHRPSPVPFSLVVKNGSKIRR